MKKFSVPILLCLAFPAIGQESFPYRVQIDRLRAIHAADAAFRPQRSGLCDCAITGPCTCGTSCTCPGCPSSGLCEQGNYTRAYQRHLQTGAPLVIRVACKDCVSIPGCCCACVPNFLGRQHACIIVGVIRDGQSYVNAELPATASIAEIRRAALPAPAAAPVTYQPPPMMMGAFAGGGC